MRSSARLADPRIAGGATGVTMERWSIGVAATYALLVPFVWLTRMDTGVVFCRRDDFVRVGGYSEERHFGEDLDFLWKLTRLASRRGQRLTRLRPYKAIASTRKFDRHGDWHYFADDAGARRRNPAPEIERQRDRAAVLVRRSITAATGTWNSADPAMVYWYQVTNAPQTKCPLVVERVQTGVRLEKRMLKVLKALADNHDLTLGDLIEGIVLHAFEGGALFGQTRESRRVEESVRPDPEGLGFPPAARGGARARKRR